MVVVVCSTCEGINQPSVCTSCINSRTAEARRSLDVILKRRDSLRERLDRKLEALRAAEVQRQWRFQRSERRRRLLDNLEGVSKKIQACRALVASRGHLVREREQQLGHGQQELAARRRELMEKLIPSLVHLQALAQVQATSDLAKARRAVLRQLRAVLPLRLAAGGGGTGTSTPTVRVCNARLPDIDDLLSVPPAELAAALGYLLQFVALAARYTYSPILHCAGFVASSSRIWQRASWFNPRPLDPSVEYPLFLPRPGSGSGSGVGMEEANAAASGDGLSRSSGAEMRVRLAGGGMPGGSAYVDSGIVRDLRKGVSLLRRSTACIVAHGWTLAAPGAGPLPTPSPPWAALALLLSALTRDPRGGAAAPGSASHAGPPWLASSVRWDGGGEGNHGASIVAGDAVFWGRQSEFVDDSDDEAPSGPPGGERGAREAGGGGEALDDWDLVEPALPPPPSREVDVEHWTRAMILDAKH